MTNLTWAGELETTLLRSSARSANLRAILADDENVRSVVLEMITTMESIDKEEVRGFRLANQLDPGAPQFMVDAKAKLHMLEARTYQILCHLISQTNPNLLLSLPKEAHSVEEIAFRGVGYATSRSRKFRSSRIIFHLASNPSDETLLHRAGIIQDIFQYTYWCGEEETKSFYLSVWEYVRHDPTHDPYPNFGFAGGFLCGSRPLRFHVLEPSQVISHFGLTKMNGKYTNCIHVMPLDRVCDHPWCLCYH